MRRLALDDLPHAPNICAWLCSSLLAILLSAEASGSTMCQAVRSGGTLRVPGAYKQCLGRLRPMT